jgi:hypothetical protein
MTSNFVPAVELIYRKLSQGSPPRPTPVKQEPQKAELTRADIELILQHKRHSNPAELQFIIDHARHFHLSDVEKNTASVKLTVEMAAERARLQRRPDNSAVFIHRVLGYAETPHGLLANRDFFESEFKAGAVAISRCTRHRPPRCDCWRDAREMLWSISDRYGAKSPEAFAAQSIWESLEELEMAARPERKTAMPTNLDFD